MADLNERDGTWIGRVLTDASGHRIGKIDDIYTDDDTGQPEWLAVSTGLLGPNTYLVPMRGATVSGRGVQVPFPKDQVRSASSSTVDGRLSRRGKGRLYAHYGYTYAEERNNLQRSLGFDPPGLRPPADGRGVGTALALFDEDGSAEVRELSGRTHLREVRPPADVHEDSRPTDRPDDAELLPPAGRGGGRGRWPDDEAIFGLSQPASAPRLASSGAARWR